MKIMENYTQSQGVNVTVVARNKSKIIAALLAFFLGVFGLHRFYLGRTALGLIDLIIALPIHIVLLILTVGIWGIALFCWQLAVTIYYLAISDTTFDKTYNPQYYNVTNA
ncbi:MAG: TM2 domain-containing protein [Endomicrobium sp.]|jgi:TM2 domain-containing membrane protein YozV|nr:TM2 domain-containing protein [Endomicrobium sp.]